MVGADRRRVLGKIQLVAVTGEFANVVWTVWGLVPILNRE